MWHYRLTDLECAPIGEVQNATSRTLNLRVNGPSTASFVIKANNALMADLFSNDTLLQVWEDKELHFNGFVVSTEMTGSTGGMPTIAVNAIDPAWRLFSRLMDPDGEGLDYKGEPIRIATKLIERLNRNNKEYPTNRDTRIKTDETLLEENLPHVPYRVEPFDLAIKGITDMSHQIDGFDWRIEPLEGEIVEGEPHEIELEEQPGPYEGGEEAELKKIGAFTGGPTFGKDLFGGGADDVFFEFGFGKKNIASFTYKRDLQDLVNKAFHIPDEGLVAEGGNAQNVVNDADVESLNKRGRFEEVASASGLNSDQLREAWLAEVIRVKKNPRYVVEATLARDIDLSLKEDFWLGDNVTIRGKVEGTALFSGVVRIYGIDINIDENGGTDITPIFLDEEGSAL